MSDKFNTLQAPKRTTPEQTGASSEAGFLPPNLGPIGSQKRRGPSRARIIGLVILLLTLVVQQLQINDLKADLEASQELVSNLRIQTRSLQSRNEQIFDILRQFESRIGYMDNKVEHVIEDNVEKEQRLQAAQSQRVPIPSATEPAEERSRRGSVLREMFGGLFR